MSYKTEELLKITRLAHLRMYMIIIGVKNQNWLAGDSKNEGISHDVIDNKGPVPGFSGISHDVYDK